MILACKKKLGKTNINKWEWVRPPHLVWEIFPLNPVFFLKTSLSGTFWGGTSWVHQASGSPTSIIIWCCWCTDGAADFIATPPLSIISDILKAPAFWKYCTCWVFCSLFVCVCLCCCLQKFFFTNKINILLILHCHNGFPSLMYKGRYVSDGWMDWIGLDRILFVG